MAKRKKGSIVIPFLVSFFIGLILIGGTGLYIFKQIQKSDEVELSEPMMQSTNTASYEDSHTVLFILDTPDKACSSTFMLMRSIPKEKRVLCIGIPANSISVIDGVQYSIAEYYADGGPLNACKFAEQIFDIEIPKYMIFNEEAFCKLSDIMGGVSYAVSVDIQGFEDTTNEQFLNGKQIVTLLTYPFFNDGEKQRASIVGSLISSMINQSDGERLADGIDRNFNSLINMVDTNITAVDFKDRRNAVKFMLNYGTTISRFRIVTGQSTGNYFLIDESFPKEIKEEYFVQHKDGASDE